MKTRESLKKELEQFSIDRANWLIDNGRALERIAPKVGLVYKIRNKLAPETDKAVYFYVLSVNYSVPCIVGVPLKVNGDKIRDKKFMNQSPPVFVERREIDFFGLSENPYPEILEKYNKSSANLMSEEAEYQLYQVLNRKYGRK